MDKEFFVEGLEKYQHFSTGLMFAIAAAAVQSSKLESVGLRAAAIEVISWGLLIGAAVLGVFAARLYTRTLKHLEKVNAVVDEYNGTIKSIEEGRTILTIENPIKGESSRRSISARDHLQGLSDEHEDALHNLWGVQDQVENWSKTQLILFTIGLVLLALARSSVLWGTIYRAVVK